MYSSNPVRVPQIKDLRVLALDEWFCKSKRL
jgi:hypothetical protein